MRARRREPAAAALADYHVHTSFSIDCATPMAAACEAAIGAGLVEIAFTDHADFGPDRSTGHFAPREYLAAIDACREAYRDRLVVRAGVELGEPHLFPDGAQAVLDAGAFDLVLGSAHYAVGMKAAWRREYFDQPLPGAYRAYFRQVAELAAKGDFDVLAHIDLVKRDARRFGQPYGGPEAYADLIRPALASLVGRGKGLEINASPLHRGQDETCPSVTVARWYREMGGEIVTLGSDAHQLDAVGAFLGAARDVALAAGFTRVARFARRRATLVPL